MRTCSMSLLMLATLLLAPKVGYAEFDLLGAVPAEYEVVASLNARQVLDSAAFQKAWPSVKKPESDAQLALLQALTGVDLLKDVDRFSLFSRVNDDDSVGVVFEGRFEEQRLVLVIQASGTHRTFSHRGRTVHEWFDKGEDRLKFATFPNAGALMIWNSRPAMEASLGALANRGSSLAASTDVAIIPSNADDIAGWGVLITRQETCPGAKLRLAHATVTMELSGEQISASFLATPESADLVPQWLDMARGAVALGQIQRDHAGLASLAGLATVAATTDNRAVEVRATTDVGTLLGLADRR